MDYEKEAWKLIEQGDAHLAAGDLAQALCVYRTACDEAFPDFVVGHLRYADTLLQSGQFDESFRYRMKILDLSPQLQNTYRRLLEPGLNDEQVEIAIQKCRKALFYYPNLSLIHTTLGTLLTRQKKTNEALTSLQTAVYMQTMKSHPDFVTNEWSHEGSRGPDFLVLGGMKCGTTSLFSHLCKHPQVISPLIKEIHYFDEHLKNGADWYRAHFPSVASSSTYVTGEATPYLGTIDTWLEIAKFNPDLKFIVILRDPVERAFSHYHHNIRQEGTNYDFRSAIEDTLNDRRLHKRMQRDDQAYRELESHYLLLGLYALLLNDWFKHFDRKQFLFVKTDELISKPQIVVDEVFDFLGIDPFQIETFEKKNAGMYQSHAQLDPDMHQSLCEFYQPFNVQLREMLGIEFGGAEATSKKSLLDFGRRLNPFRNRAA